MLFDTHSHIYFEPLCDDISWIIERMKEKGVSRAVQIGCDLASSEKAIALSREYPEYFRASVWIHPSECTDYILDETIKGLELIIRTHRDYIVGIWETGLDYHYFDPSTVWWKITAWRNMGETQNVWFRAQSDLAKKYDIPLIIHTRDARDDTLKCIEEFDIHHAVMHCYSEDMAFAETLLGHSDEIYFSFSGTLTYKKSEHIRETAAMLPLNRILIETDSPFLPPQAVRGSTNESANVRYIFETLCELRPEMPEVIENALWESSCRFYGWIHS